MSRIPVSVVIIAKNEEDGIAECLASVAGWADEIIVVDDFSTDKTVEVIRRFPATIFQRKMENEGRHRNWAYAQTRNAWVLSLDADEQVTPELKEEIDEVLPTATCQAFALPIKTYIGDYWVRYAGWYPARKIRLFLKDRCRYEEAEVHPRPILDGTEHPLNCPIDHKGYPDFEHLIASVNRQSTLEAQKWLRTGRNVTGGMVVRRTADRFVRSYIRKRGFKDGIVGFIIGLCASLYQILSYAKYWELKRKTKGEPISEKIKSSSSIGEPLPAKLIAEDL
jgi:glycosyltransferase involved in cell wall biosynthesis